MDKNEEKLESLKYTAECSLAHGSISEASFKKAWSVFYVEAHNKLPVELAEEFDQADYSGVMWTVKDFIEELQKLDPESLMQFASFDKKLNTCLAFVEAGVNEHNESLCFVIGSSRSTPDIMGMLEALHQESSQSQEERKI